MLLSVRDCLFGKHIPDQIKSKAPSAINDPSISQFVVATNRIPREAPVPISIWQHAMQRLEKIDSLSPTTIASTYSRALLLQSTMITRQWQVQYHESCRTS